MHPVEFRIQPQHIADIVDGKPQAFLLLHAPLDVAQARIGMQFGIEDILFGASRGRWVPRHGALLSVARKITRGLTACCGWTGLAEATWAGWAKTVQRQLVNKVATQLIRGLLGGLLRGRQSLFASN